MYFSDQPIDLSNYILKCNKPSKSLIIIKEVIQHLTFELGIKMLTISTLTNYAAGISKIPLSHNEVIINAERSKMNLIKLLKNILKRI